MSELYDWVDVFHGNGAVDLPAPQGIAATWNWLKAQVGNTHPGACLPFGMVSACAYSGAYPSGYGLYGASSTGPTPRVFDRPTATGFTHFQHSGTGYIRAFYNYLRVIPLADDEDPQRWTLVDETGAPGYYAATLAESGIRAELTVGRKAAFHRYTFPSGRDIRLVLDLATGGIDVPEGDATPQDVHVETHTPGLVTGRFTARGVTIHFHADAGLAGVKTTVTDDRVTFAGRPVDGAATLRIGFSFRSAEQAGKNAGEMSSAGFDAVRERAARAWCDALNAVGISGGTDAQRTVFASCLYHSFVKPIDCCGESPFWSDETPCYLDFATMWDQVKTQLPLVMTVDPKRGTDIVQAILATIEHLGRFPTALLIENEFDRFDKQAQALAHHTLADAYLRGIEGIDWQHALRLMVDSLATHTGPEFMSEGYVRPYTHTLDYACAAHATAVIAHGVGDTNIAGRMETLAGNWRRVYDAATGLLKSDSDFYEGSYWNYSFRPLPDMEARIALCGGTDAYIGLLDRFFGYRDIETGDVNPEPGPTFQRVVRPDRFEGLNNESDMEAPYAYVPAGRHDRTAEIVRAVMRYQFGPGPGGLPGNDDNGGLSSWYVWNAIGLYPVTGQDRVYIGSPIFDSARLTVRGGEFVIEAIDNRDSHVHVQAVELNGKRLNRRWLRVDELTAGGRLSLAMGPEPV